MDSPSPAVSSASKPRQRPRRAGVRVVAKVRDAGSPEMSGPPQVSILRPDGDCPSLVFADQASSRKDSYKMDWCYGQDDGTSEVFAREVKPLLQGVCHGTNACIMSYGPRGTGKTLMIQGSEENPGLAPMAVSEILFHAEEIGGFVSISCYEVCQDHVYDLLEPKEQEVLVLEDASRRVQLKGLSVVPVQSVSDFNKLYFDGSNQRKLLHKGASDVATRSHRGLIVYVNATKPNLTLVGKISFVDLAGYEDVKKNTNFRTQLAESAKVNKPLYALLNVVAALNSDESFISYRDSKLTRLLQDFLCDGNGAVLITCLNSTLSQDTIHAVSLASRSCRAINQRLHDSAKCSKSTPKVASSPVNRSTEKKKEGTTSVTKRRAQALPNSVQKPAFTLSRLNDKKINHTPSVTKGRKLFNAASPTTHSIQGIISANATTIVNTSKKSFVQDNTVLHRRVLKPSIMKEDIFLPNTATTRDTQEKDNPVLHRICGEPSIMEEEVCESYDAKSLGSSVSEVDNFSPNATTTLNKPKKDDPLLHCTSMVPYLAEKDNPLLHCTSVVPYVAEEEVSVSYGAKSVESPASDVDDVSSELVSVSIPQVDFLCSRQLGMHHVEPRTPVQATKVDFLCSRQLGMHHVEPRTPVQATKVYYNSAFEDTSTPQEALEAPSAGLKEVIEARSAGLKKTLVHETLSYLNSASKEDLKKLKGIGEKRADYILQLREREGEPFKEISNLKKLGLNSKQINEMMTTTLGDFSDMEN